MTPDERSDRRTSRAVPLPPLNVQVARHKSSSPQLGFQGILTETRSEWLGIPSMVLESTNHGPDNRHISVAAEKKIAWSQAIKSR